MTEFINQVQEEMDKNWASLHARQNSAITTLRHVESDRTRVIDAP